MRALLSAGVRGDALHDQCKKLDVLTQRPSPAAATRACAGGIGSSDGMPHVFIAYLGKVWYRTVWYLPVRIAARPQQSSERSPSPARLLRGIGAVP